MTIFIHHKCGERKNIVGHRCSKVIKVKLKSCKALIFRRFFQKKSSQFKFAISSEFFEILKLHLKTITLLE